MPQLPSHLPASAIKFARLGHILARCPAFLSDIELLQVEAVQWVDRDGLRSIIARSKAGEIKMSPWCASQLFISFPTRNAPCSASACVAVP